MGQGSTVSDERFGEHDPDAPWRPGFDGWAPPPTVEDDAGIRSDSSDLGDDERWSREHDEMEPEPWVPVRPERTARRPVQPAGAPVATVEGLPPRAVTGEIILTGLGVAAVVLAVLLAVSWLRPTDRVLDADPAARVIPTTAEIAWTTEIDARVGLSAVGDGVVALTSALSGDLSALDVETGEVLWERSLDDRDIEQLAVIDGHVVVQQRGATGGSEARSIDGLTGSDVWQSSPSDAGTFTLSGVGSGSDAVLMRRFRADDASFVELVDPADGSVIGEALRLANVTASQQNIAVQPLDREVAVWSIDEMDVIAGPVDAFNLRTVAALHGTVVALDLEGRIVTHDTDGRRTDEQPFVSDAFGEFRGRAELAGVLDGPRIAIVSSGSSVGFTIDEGAITVAWRRTGRVFAPVDTDRGAASVLVGPGEETGEIRDTIIDPASGSTIVVTDRAGKRERQPVLGWNAYVVAPHIGAPVREVEAFGYDGEALWSLTVPAGADYEIYDGIVVIVDDEGDGSTVSVAR